MKTLIASVAFGIISLSTFAQPRVGFMLGTNFSSSISHNYRSNETPYKSVVLPSATFFFDIPVSSTLSMMSGMSYNPKGAQVNFKKINSVNNEWGGTIYPKDNYDKLRIDYLEVPLSLRYKVKTISIYGGLYAAYCFGGKEKYNILQPAENNPDPYSPAPGKTVKGEAEVSTGTYDGYNGKGVLVKATDFGFQTGLTIDLSKRLFIALQYSRGIKSYTANYSINGKDYRNPTREYNQYLGIRLGINLGSSPS